MNERRRFKRWLAIMFGVNVTMISIGFGWASFGLVWVDVIVIIFLAAAFVVASNLDTSARIARSTDARPHIGYIVHADGSQTAVRFVATSDPGEFVAVTLNGERAIMREGDELKIDQVRSGQLIRFKYKD